MPDRFIACSTKRSRRKLVLWSFQLLEADDIGLCLLEPPKEYGQATIDSVDVERSNLQVSLATGVSLHDRSGFSIAAVAFAGFANGLRLFPAIL